MDDFNNNDNSQFIPPIPPMPQPTPEPTPTAQPENPTVMQPPVNENTYYQQAPVMNAPNTPSVQPTTDGLGIASMVLGIVSVVVCCCYGAGLLLAIPGLILGLVAKKSPITGKRSGFALAGIIISSISIGLNLIFLIYVIAALSTGLENYEDLFKQFQDELGNEYNMFTKL